MKTFTTESVLFYQNLNKSVDFSNFHLFPTAVSLCALSPLEWGNVFILSLKELPLGMFPSAL